MTTNKQPSEQALKTDIDALYQVLEYACIDDGHGSLHLNRKSFDWATENFIQIVQKTHTQPAPSADLEQLARAATDKILNALAMEGIPLSSKGYDMVESIFLSHFRGVESGDERVREVAIEMFDRLKIVYGSDIEAGSTMERWENALAQPPQPPSWQSEKKELIRVLRDISQLGESGNWNLRFAKRIASEALKKAGAQ